MLPGALHVRIHGFDDVKWAIHFTSHIPVLVKYDSQLVPVPRDTFQQISCIHSDHRISLPLQLQSDVICLFLYSSWLQSACW